MGLGLKAGIASAALGALAALSISNPARAASWHWQVAPGLQAKAAVALSNQIFALSTEAVSPGGYKIMRYGGGNTWTWYEAGGATALTVSERNQLWAVALDNSVWVHEGAWFYIPTNICENGSAIQIRQAPGDNTIAVGSGFAGNDIVYVVSNGTLRWWTGSCWSKLPALPSGTVKEVAIYDDASTVYDDGAWVSNFSGAIYRWNENISTWEAITTGIAAGLNSNRQAIGWDNASLWTFTTSGNFTVDTTWTYGGISQLGNTTGSQVTKIVVGTDKQVYQYWFD